MQHFKQNFFLLNFSLKQKLTQADSFQVDVHLFPTSLKLIVMMFVEEPVQFMIFPSLSAAFTQFGQDFTVYKLAEAPLTIHDLKGERGSEYNGERLRWQTTLKDLLM